MAFKFVHLHMKFQINSLRWADGQWHGLAGPGNVSLKSCHNLGWLERSWGKRWPMDDGQLNTGYAYALRITTEWCDAKCLNWAFFLSHVKPFLAKSAFLRNELIQVVCSKRPLSNVSWWNLRTRCRFGCRSWRCTSAACNVCRRAAAGGGRSGWGC